MSDVSERIYNRMQELGLKHKDLVEKTGASKGTVSTWTSGLNSPTGERLIKLADVLKTTPEWLLTGGSNAVITDKKIQVWEDGDPIPEGFAIVEYLYDTYASAGGGYLNGDHMESKHLLFRTDTMTDCNVHADSARVIVVHGDSMWPELTDGQTIAVDTSATRVFNGEIYAINHNGEIKVKYLFNWNDEGQGGLRVVSRNEDKLRFPDEFYSPEKLESENIKIIGQYWWKSEVRKVRR